MRNRLLIAAALGAALVCGIVPGGATTARAGDVTITGAGATFPYPLYARWAYDYQAETGVKLNYQSIGSGGGIAQIKAKTVDFGASDAPLTADQLDEAGLMQWPMTMGGVVPVINVPGLAADQVQLSGSTLADIFLGKVTKWNDPAIVATNAGVKLPDMDITVVHRADGSGTTWIFTNYLSKVSTDWKTKIGNDKAVAWPAGVGGKGNEGVAAYVQRIKGSIGYVEYAYCLQNKMANVKLQNHDGAFVSPTAGAFQAAAANADWAHAPGFYMVLTDQPGQDSWPITGATFILMHKQQQDAATAGQVLKFFDWCYHNPNPASEELHYVPIPDKVVSLVETTWTKGIVAGGKPVWEQ